MASSSDARPKRSVKHCSKCKGPVRGHIRPHEALCRHPSPQFVDAEDVPELANIHHDTEASIRAHQDQINNLTAELQLLNRGSSTPLSTANMHQQHFDGVPVLTSILGKSAGDLTISAPVKNAQLWPHQFAVKLDSTIIAYKDLTLPQFVFGFLECLRQAPPSQQPPMLSHLSHLMDLEHIMLVY